MQRDVILTIYYTTFMDPQRNLYQRNNNYGYIQKFYESVINNNMNAVIFHDNLSSDFINKYQNNNVEFIKITDERYGLSSMNDIRFMIFLDYIIQNKDIRKVLISDAADVEFNCNIFEDIVDDKLYICLDRDRTFDHYYMRDRILKTYGTLIPFHTIMTCKAVQAGLFGGHVDTIKKCLEFIKYEFDNIVDKSYNCNYIVFNHVVYSEMKSRIHFSSHGSDIKTRCGKEYKMITWKKINNYTECN